MERRLSLTSPEKLLVSLKHFTHTHDVAELVLRELQATIHLSERGKNIHAGLIEWVADQHPERLLIPDSQRPHATGEEADSHGSRAT